MCIHFAHACCIRCHKGCEITRYRSCVRIYTYNAGKTNRPSILIVGFGVERIACLKFIYVYVRLPFRLFRRTVRLRLQQAPSVRIIICCSSSNWRPVSPAGRMYCPASNNASMCWKALDVARNLPASCRSPHRSPPRV